MGTDNANKSNRGKSGQENLGELIESFKIKDYIVSFTEDYRDGYKGYDEKQFFFQYLVEFANKDCWILHSTTSIRSDRMNIQQWNGEHLKRLNGYIKRAYVIYPNGLSEKEVAEAKRYQNKINDHTIYSAVDGVLSQSELFSRLEEYALGFLSNTGKLYAKSGINFEKWISEIVNSTENLLKWKNNDGIRTGYAFDYFLKIMEYTRTSKNQVVGISATTDIPKLENGGMPKTDILVEVDTYEGKMDYTFSCKKCSSDWVSVHEYTADQFINALEIADDELVEALYEFQNVGSIEKMQPENLRIMNERMMQYNKRLAKWVFSGEGGLGNQDIHWADYLITYKREQGEFSIYGVEDYISLLHEENVEGNFGTYFRWTYPSGGKGKRIQLKARIL